MFNPNLQPGRRLKIFTWHIHGSYLYYLSQASIDLYIPVTSEKNEGYYGRGETFPFGNNVIEINASEVKNFSFDCILFQTNKNFLVDQYEILSEEQRKLPRVYLEHDPPSKHPSDTKHIISDPDILVVHVTYFNKLMWQNETNNVKVIDHGIMPLQVDYSGELERGIVVINHLHQRGRKLGADIFEKVSKEVPLDLVGMGTKEYGGLGEILHPQLPSFISKYRFFFNPIRYTSLGLAVLESMTTGIPFVGLATTEYVTVVRNEVSGYIHTDVDYLIEKMKILLSDRSLAVQIGLAGKKIAEERFNIQRFSKDWQETFEQVSERKELNREMSSVRKGTNSM
jgi:glycosyltransferase involved in cell wall biosynthesis